MTEPTYFVLYPNEDGLTVSQFTASELKSRLEDGYWGKRRILAKIPKDNHNYWGEVIVIIKGEVIVPKAVEVTTKFEL